MRTVFGIGVVVGMLASAVAAHGQSASLLKGSATGSKVQFQTIVEKSTLNAPVPPGNKKTIVPQAPFVHNQPSALSKIASMLKFPTIGSNPVMSVKTQTKK